jgi:coenzyme F420-dependent glucose-6-phosphate dehydrogenase
MRAELGFHCSHEQLPPSMLLAHARRAADAGFVHAMCSDHFHPWSERQGHSGFAWSWLAAALEATSMSFGTVCAPGQRYHPAVIAQAGATLADMYPGRFWCAVGSGEALNEAVTGSGWPDKKARHERLRACVDVMRGLWAGQTVTCTGPVTVADARLYSRPAEAPPIIGAALSPDTARWLAPWVDGLVTVTGPRQTMIDIVEAFRSNGGERKPVYLQVPLSMAPTDTEARGAAVEQWRQAALPPALLADLRTPDAFDAHTRSLRDEDILARVRASSSIEQHLAWLEEDATIDFDRIYLHNVARDHQEGFIDACGEVLLPAWRATIATP